MVNPARAPITKVPPPPPPPPAPAKTAAPKNAASVDRYEGPKKVPKPKYGVDGAIPEKNRKVVDRAFARAYKLADDPKFVAEFNKTLEGLTGKKPAPDAYKRALDKMVINNADTTKNAIVRAEVQGEDKDAKTDKQFQRTRAFSFQNGSDIWLRHFHLSQGERAITGSIVHEAAHLAGAQGDLGAEMVLLAIDKASGYPR